LKNLIPEHCCAYADPNFITPIFYNYFVNAIKFSNKGTNIEVGLQPYPKKHDFLELYVKDYGQGIPPEKLATLFKRAEVKSTSGTLGEKGSGLGLYICQVFAEKCNGYVYATSDAEKGATFYLGLPKCSHDTTG
ncbi:MAG: ATP-binding protein, partial [Candidatus Woesearchaeota archaeon]